MNISTLKNRYKLNGNIEITTFPLKKGLSKWRKSNQNWGKKFFLKLLKKTDSYLFSDILRCPGNPEPDRETVKHIIQLFKDHPSIKEIKTSIEKIFILVGRLGTSL